MSGLEHVPPFKHVCFGYLAVKISGVVSSKQHLETVFLKVLDESWVSFFGGSSSDVLAQELICFLGHLLGKSLFHCKLSLVCECVTPK